MLNSCRQVGERQAAREELVCDGLIWRGKTAKFEKDQEQKTGEPPRRKLKHEKRPDETRTDFSGSACARNWSSQSRTSSSTYSSVDQWFQSKSLVR